MSRHYTHVVFDFDGTLVDSAPAILGCFCEVLAARSIAPRVEIDSRLIGPPLIETMARISGLDDVADIRQLAEDFKRRYDSDGVFATAAYAGVEEALDSLRAMGCRLHIATNKRTLPTGLILDYLGLTRYFDSVYAIDRVNPPYTHKAAMIGAQLAEQGLPAEQTCYVGDKAEDGLAADANRLAFYAVTWGYGEWRAGSVPAHWTIIYDLTQLSVSLQKSFPHG